MAAAAISMYEYESDLRSNEHHLSSSENKAGKNSGLYGIWTRPYSFISLQFTYMIFIYLYFTGLFPKQRHDELPVGSWAQLVERCTDIAEVKGSSPVQAWFFFWP